VDRAGRGDNFFHLGGHSLIATQLVVRIQSTLQVELPMKLLFAHPTLRDLATRIGELRRARLLNELASGGEDIEALFENVTSMSEGQIRELMREMTLGGRP
jgi:hypothetical protein